MVMDNWVDEARQSRWRSARAFLFVFAHPATLAFLESPSLAHTFLSLHSRAQRDRTRRLETRLSS